MRINYTSTATWVTRAEQDKNYYHCYRGQTSLDGAGVGMDKPSNLTAEDDEFEAYRKRMMLAYRFRPNPLVSSPHAIQFVVRWLELCSSVCSAIGVDGIIVWRVKMVIAY